MAAFDTYGRDLRSTTAEIVLLAFEEEVYTRRFDEATGYDELVVSPSSAKPGL